VELSTSASRKEILAAKNPPQISCEAEKQSPVGVEGETLVSQ